AALTRLHDVREEGLDLNDLALLGILGHLDARLFGHVDLLYLVRCSIGSAAAAADRDLDVLLCGQNSSGTDLGEDGDALRCGEANTRGGLRASRHRREADSRNDGPRIAVG